MANKHLKATKIIGGLMIIGAPLLVFIGYMLAFSAAWGGTNISLELIFIIAIAHFISGIIGVSCTPKRLKICLIAGIVTLACHLFFSSFAF